MPQRRCIVTRSEQPTSQLIRFVRSPTGEAVPDLTEKLPGRGAWVSTERGMITAAASKKLFNKAFKQATKAPEDLEAKTATLLRQRCLTLLSLARQRGMAVCGFMKVKEAAQQSDGVFLLAIDASENAAKKLKNLSDGRALLCLFTSDELAQIFARETAINIFVHDDATTKTLQKELNRLFALCENCVT